MYFTEWPAGTGFHARPVTRISGLTLTSADKWPFCHQLGANSDKCMRFFKCHHSIFGGQGRGKGDIRHLKFRVRCLGRTFFHWTTETIKMAPKLKGCTRTGRQPFEERHVCFIYTPISMCVYLCSCVCVCLRASV